MKQPRQSNIELLRILCMLAILGDHLTGQSGIAVFGQSLPQTFAFALLGCGARIACSVFVLAGSWFLCGQPFATRRPLGLWCSLWLYTVPVTLLCAALGKPVTAGTLRWAVFPASTRQLWFVSDYLVLLLCQPLLERVLHGLPRAGHKALLLAAGVPLVAYPTLFAEDGVLSDLAWMFLYLYLLAAYLRRWPDNRISRLLRRRPVALVLGLGLPLLNTAARAWLECNGATGKAVQYVMYYRSALGALPNLAAALAWFTLFQGLDLGRRRGINAVASTTLGVYILHQVPAARDLLWNDILHAPQHAGSVGYAVFALLATFAGCALLDALRTKLVMQPLQRSRWFRTICAKGDAAAALVAPPGSPTSPNAP